MWTCQICDSEVGDSLDSCHICENPKAVDSESISFLRNEWKKEIKRNPRGNYSPKEERTEYDYSQWKRDLEYPLKTFGNKLGSAILVSPIFPLLAGLYFFTDPMFSKPIKGIIIATCAVVFIILCVFVNSMTKVYEKKR